jgi:hypothetical protein
VYQIVHIYSTYPEYTYLSSDKGVKKMPFSRFAKMPSEKRERLLTIAAQEFAAPGIASETKIEASVRA